MPHFPNELLDHIAQDTIHVPVSLSTPLPAHFPLLFPDNPTPPNTGVMAFAYAQHSHLAIVRKYSWKHVVLSKPSHADGILAMAGSASTPPQWDRTVRCDIFLPYEAVPRNVAVFLSAMPHLTTLIWTYPPLEAFANHSPVVSPSLRTLQIRSLPKSFAPKHFESLASAFPNVTRVNVVSADDIDLNSVFTPPTTSLWTDLSHLSVGTRTTFMPESRCPDNLLLILFLRFPTGTLFPSLRKLCLQDNVVEVTPFLHQHASSLSTLNVSAGRSDLAEILMQFNAPPPISTLILNVAPLTAELPPLPPSVTKIVILQPFVPVWRKLPTLRHCLNSCLRRVAELWTPSLLTVLCEERLDDTEGWLKSQTSFFRALPVTFDTFVFGGWLVLLRCRCPLTGFF